MNPGMVWNSWTFLLLSQVLGWQACTTSYTWLICAFFIGWVKAIKALIQWFSPFLMLWPFNSVPHVVSSSIVILLLLWIVEKISVFSNSLWQPLWNKSFNPKRGPWPSGWELPVKASLAGISAWPWNLRGPDVQWLSTSPCHKAPFSVMSHLHCWSVMVQG